jgi:hypothetical protein
MSYTRFVQREFKRSIFLQQQAVREVSMLIYKNMLLVLVLTEITVHFSLQSFTHRRSISTSAQSWCDPKLSLPKYCEPSAVARIRRIARGPGLLFDMYHLAMDRLQSILVQPSKPDPEVPSLVLAVAV